MAEKNANDEQPNYILGAGRIVMWVLMPAAACIIQLRQASKLPAWSGYLRFMAAWQLLGIAHRLAELWVSRPSRARR